MSYMGANEVCTPSRLSGSLHIGPAPEHPTFRPIGLQEPYFLPLSQIHFVLGIVRVENGMTVLVPWKRVPYLPIGTEQS